MTSYALANEKKFNRQKLFQYISDGNVNNVVCSFEKLSIGKILKVNMVMHLVMVDKISPDGTTVWILLNSKSLYFSTLEEGFSTS